MVQNWLHFQTFISERWSRRDIPRSETLQERKYVILQRGREGEAPQKQFFELWVNFEVSALSLLRKRKRRWRDFCITKLRKVRVVKNRKANFPDAEEKLEAEVAKRRCVGDVSGLWLKARMKQIVVELADTEPDKRKASEFKASNNWLQCF